MDNERRIKYLQKKVAALTNINVEEKYRKKFERYARYLGHGVYEWQGVQAQDTSILFLKGVLCMENVKFVESIED